MPKLTKEEQDQILLLDEKGLSTRQIAKEIFGDRLTRKTTIHDFLVGEGWSRRKNYTNQDRVDEKEELYKPSHNVKILFLDIETAPSAGFYFGKRYEINISQDQVISESFILTYSAKYLGNENVVYGALNYEEVKEEDDYRIVKELYDLLNRTDIVVAHNGKAFDVKVINTRLVYHGFNPPAPYKVIDTLLLARRAFKFPSNKLDSLCRYMGLPAKSEHEGFNMWKGYLHGDQECMEKMLMYNINDTIILEQLYMKLRAWDTQHPNLNVYDRNFDVCPCCGSESFVLLDKKSYTNMSAFTTLRCQDCGKVFKNRGNILESRVKYTTVI